MKPDNPTQLYTAQQIKNYEQQLFDRGVVRSFTLMHRAAQAVLDHLCVHPCDFQSIVIVCGPGNNAGDGYVLARLLGRAWNNIQVISVANAATLQGDAATARDIWLGSGNTITAYTGTLPQADLIIDCLFGTGLSRPLERDYLKVIEQINQSESHVIAIDIPSGLDSDRGIAFPVAVEANETLTFIGYKRGQFLADGPTYCGRLTLATLGMQIEAAVNTNSIRLMSLGSAADAFRARKHNSHKGDYGHIVVIGGAPGYQGAVRLCAEAALRTGAGLVSVITHPEHSQSVCALVPEIMCHGANDAEGIQSVLDKADVIVVGPGLDDSPWSLQWLAACKGFQGPLVVDAGALRQLASSSASYNTTQWVLTPHPGEAADLLRTDSKTVQDDRVESLMEIQHRYLATTILKGAGSLLYDGKSISLCQHGNPGMATAGMGDVLSGIIAACCIDQSTAAAAETAVEVHALAGDRATSNHRQRGLIASDLFPHIRKLVNQQVTR